MPGTNRNDETMEFDDKVSELDFDVWGTEEDDGTARRLDPLRRRSRSTSEPQPEEDEAM